MYIVYGVHFFAGTLNYQPQIEAQTLSEAMLLFQKLVEQDVADPHGSVFIAYGIVAMDCAECLSPTLAAPPCGARFVSRWSEARGQR